MRRLGSLLIVLALVLGAGTGAGAAQSWGDGAPETPRFEVCLPGAMGAFEAALQGPGYGADWRLAETNVHWVQHCGYLAMGICEVSRNSLICQRRLRAGLEARSAALRDLLPAPGAVTGGLAPLYARVWALAHGQDAGDACAGWDYRRGLWCDSFQAALQFEEAVHAWQVARLMGVMGPLDWEDLSDLASVQ